MSNPIDDAIVALTPAGRKLMTAVGNLEFSYFDDGIVAGSGIWGVCLAQEHFETARSAGGVMARTAKLGLWKVTDSGDEDGAWWALTELGASVAQQLANDAADETPVEEAPAPAAKPLTKTEAYELVKYARLGLRKADEAIYTGTDGELRAALDLAIGNAQKLQALLAERGVNGL